MIVALDMAILVLGVSINTALGVLVYVYNRRSASGRVFLVTVALVVLWVVANYNVDTSNSAKEALLWLRILYALAIGYVSSFFIFATLFPRPNKFNYPIREYFLLYMISAILATLFSEKVFVAAVIGPGGLSSITFGPLYMVQNVIGLLSVVGSLIILWKKRKISEAIEQKQIEVVVAGWIVFLLLIVIVGAVIPYFAPVFIEYSKIIPLFSTIMVGATAYAIIRHQFLDIRIIVQRGLIYTLLFSGIIGVYIIVLHTLGMLFHGITNTTTMVSAGLTSVLCTFTAPTIDRYLRKKTDRYFHKDTYNYPEALFLLSKTVNNDVILEDIVKHTEDTLREIFRTRAVSITLANEMDHPMESPESRRSLFIPIMFRENRIGMIHLEEKLSGDRYTDEDISLLETFAHQVATAFEKARLYKEVDDYSRELEERVRERTRRIEEMRERETQMMLDISHRLQNPLTIIKGEIAFLRNQMGNQSDIAAFERSIDDISAFIYDLLRLARLDSAEETFVKNICDLSTLLNELTEYYETIARSKNILLSSRIESGICVFGNSERLQELVTNLVSNAVKYMDTDTSKPRRIDITLEMRSGSAAIVVADTGMGITTEDLPHIFKRFYRIEDRQRRSIGGTGLGLAITKKIIDLHNGNIEVESELGRGTTMTVLIPAIPCGTTTHADSVRDEITHTI